MHSNCILDTVANILVCHMVFVGNVQKPSIASHLKGLDPILLSISAVTVQLSQALRKVDKMSVCISLTLEASEMFFFFHMIFSLERFYVVWAKKCQCNQGNTLNQHDIMETYENVQTYYFVPNCETVICRKFNTTYFHTQVTVITTIV